jgi:hypothetical protein
MNPLKIQVETREDLDYIFDNIKLYCQSNQQPGLDLRLDEDVFLEVK